MIPYLEFTLWRYMEVYDGDYSKLEILSWEWQKVSKIIGLRLQKES